MSALLFLDPASNNSNAFLEELHSQIHLLAPSEKEEFEERAAIMEYEAQLSKEEAEWRALRIILENRIRMAV